MAVTRRKLSERTTISFGMTKTGHHHYANSWRAYGALYLLLLALVVRGLIPVGYMPDTGALRDGRILITLCITSGNGTSTIPEMLADLLADGTSHPEDVLAGNDCPFSLLSHQALDVLVLPRLQALLVASFSALTRTFDNTVLPVLGARGPPLGSRAPPFFFS